MAVRKCCIENCKSCSTRKEDKGVTYHKFPKDVTSRIEWQSITHCTHTSRDLPIYVCSRHFCKRDFLKNKDSKYILKPDAVPSIFPWTVNSVNMDESQIEESLSLITNDDEKNISSSSKESEEENLNAIKKFIEEQEKEIQEKRLGNKEHLKETPEKESNNEEHVKVTPDQKSGNKEHVEVTSEQKSDNEEHVKVTPERKSHSEEHVKVTTENKSDNGQHVEETSEKKSDNKEHVAVTPEKNTDNGDHVKVTPENNSNAEEKLIMTPENHHNIGESADVALNIKSDNKDQEKEVQKERSDNIVNVEQALENANTVKNVTTNEHIDVTSSVMDFIHSESESQISEKNTEVTDTNKQTLGNQKILSPSEKGSSSMSLSVGSKVEVKDFGDDWYPAEIAEVDYEEIEVLVQYEIEFKKPDEWINVSSPRLRPFTGARPKPPVAKDPDPPKEKVAPPKEKSILKKLLATDIEEEPKEDAAKIEEKPKLLFEVGERCLARWRDNRRFVATITKDLGDGQYEIVFDDGFHWTCNMSRLYKMKADSLTIDTLFQSATTGSPTLQDNTAPGTSNAAISPSIPVFHTHLFDPSRDYLCSKSERREKKRKLNIKEIFNIGQKRSKIPKTETEKTPKTPVEKKPRVVKKNIPQLKIPRVVLNKEVKLELPDALASIIGTKENEQEIKHEPVSDVDDEKKTTPCNKTVVNAKKHLDLDNLADEIGNTTNEIKEEVDFENMDDDSMEPISCIVNPNDKTLDDEDLEEQKSDGDPVLEEEVTLENFEKQDTEKHEAVIDKIKEAINKLEDGISEIQKGQSPRVERVFTPKLERALTPKLERALTPKLERALTPKLEKVLTPKSERAYTPKLEGLDTPKSEIDMEISNTEITEDVKPQDLKDVLAEVAASIDIEEPNLKPESSKGKNAIVRKAKVLKPKKDPSKVKKSRKLRLLQEKKVKQQVQKVKNELELMKKQFEEMRTQMMVQSQEISQPQDNAPLPESYLLPGEWCCRWVNGQPVGKVSEIEGVAALGLDNKPVLPRRSVEVYDKRLPPGWTKHMVRRSVGHSAGKWDVVLVSPEEHGNKKFHTKTDMRNFLEHSQDETLKQYEHALTDFGVHLKLARRMGWIVNTPDGIAEAPETILPAGTTCQLSPLVKRKNIHLKRREQRPHMKPKKRGLMLKDKKRRPIKLKLQKGLHTYNSQLVESETSAEIKSELSDYTPEQPVMPLEDGFEFVGSLKVQIIENLLRCPAEGCFKNFRTKTLLQMHIKHYHRELIKLMGATPKVLDLAYARTMPNEADMPQTEKKVIKVKINKPARRDEHKIPVYDMDSSIDGMPTTPTEDTAPIIPRIPRSQDSPKLRQALVHKPVKRPRVLLPVRRVEPEQPVFDSIDEDIFEDQSIEPLVEVPMLEHPLDFETAISTHTVTKPLEKKKKGDKKKSFASFSKHVSEDEEWFAMNSDELDTRSSFPRSGSPDSKMDGKMAPMSSESNDDQKGPNLYTYTETGERIKIVHMKREEIINCHCGVREEDGLMVQCELCLCWQHALCHNIQRECEVPEKYTCSICLNPRRGRRSMRFVHDQDRLYEGVLPGAAASEPLRRLHELCGNLLRLRDALHALRCKRYVATKKDHPKLYLWACDWEEAEIAYTQEKLNSDYSDLNIMINGIDKENLPISMRPDTETEETSSLPDEDQDSDRLSQRDNQLGSQALLSGLLSSPGGASLDLNISTSELERLAKSVTECSDWQRAPLLAPQPEAAIENEACRRRLRKHIQRCQALIDSRLDSIEAQVAELESQDPSFGENYEGPELYPRTKQTIQMLMRDLDTMEELGVIT